MLSFLYQRPPKTTSEVKKNLAHFFLYLGLTGLNLVHVITLFQPFIWEKLVVWDGKFYSF